MVFQSNTTSVFTIVWETVDFMELANEIRAVYSNYKLPTRYAPTWLVRLFGGFLGVSADMRKHMIGTLCDTQRIACFDTFVCGVLWSN